MFGIGMPEMLLILAVALIVIGPKKLPDLAKSLGRALGEFRKATSELKDSFQVDELKEVKTTFNELNRDLKDQRPAPPGPTPKDAADEPQAGVGSGAARPDSDPMDTVKAAFNRDEALDPEARPAADQAHPAADASEAGVEPGKA